MRLVEIEVELYKAKVTIVWSEGKNPDIETLVRENYVSQELADYLSESGFREGGHGRSVSDGPNQVVFIGLDHLSVLVHELFHVVENILLARHIPHSEDTSEAWAYLLEFLTFKATTSNRTLIL